MTAVAKADARDGTRALIFALIALACGHMLSTLLRTIPAAEASEGHDAEAGRDITHLSVLIDDAIDSGEGDLAEALRPLYLDYLVKHGVAADGKPRADDTTGDR